MIVSRNEIESLTLKAARGAGMSWGLAEEASVAAGWLAEQDLPWADTLVGVLSSVHTTSTPRIAGHALAPSLPGTWLCPIRTGALLSDLGAPAAAMEIRDVLAPVWLAPFLATWTAPDRGVDLGWRELQLLLTPSGLLRADATQTDTLAAASSTHVAIAWHPIDRVQRSPPRRACSGYVVADGAWRALAAFEHASYVPASTRSRVAGAGAGLLDND